LSTPFRVNCCFTKSYLAHPLEYARIYLLNSDQKQAKLFQTEKNLVIGCDLYSLAKM
jgi:hypothetical protein